MNRRLNLSLCLVAFVTIAVPASAHAADVAQTARKYPPYPEVWGYELPWPESNARSANPSVFRMDNGDFFVTYVKKRTRSLRKDSTCCDFKSSYANLLFFAGEEDDTTAEKIDAFVEKNRRKRVQPGDHKSLIFTDGSTIERGGRGHTHCYGSFEYFIVRKDRAGNVLARKTLLYLRDKPREQSVNPICEGSGGLDRVYERVEAVFYNFIQLNDDTFLIYEPGGNLLIRFDKDLNTKFKNDRAFLIDTDVIDKLKKELTDKNSYNDQTINDAVTNYLLSLARRK